MSFLLRVICQLKKMSANKIMPAFTICKLGLHRILLQSHFRHTCLGPVVNNNYRQNRRKAMCKKTK